MARSLTASLQNACFAGAAGAASALPPLQLPMLALLLVPPPLLALLPLLLLLLPPLLVTAAASVPQQQSGQYIVPQLVLDLCIMANTS